MAHPSFYNHLSNVKGLQNHFNIMEPTQLTVYTDTVASVVYEDGSMLEMCVELEPYYDKCIGIGVQPNVTSYTIEHKMPMCQVGKRALRYVIWTMGKPLLVSATVVACTNVFGLSNTAP